MFVLNQHNQSSTFLFIVIPSLSNSQTGLEKKIQKKDGVFCYNMLLNRVE
ncbi:hypothetical protein KP78_04200 [Jeotgalibacillus soli]|uniref:Uncharacterized protein n=1 Tax=Jeotgalibacillus soli TaxID=889306 RepID=A0A0C2SDM3_9BACL|nr:hypothetical protein KP78_04200 [Jeotgalibacillus soli]